MMLSVFRSSSISSFTVFTLTFCLITGVLYAGTTGKLTGKVTNIETDEPIPNANIVEKNIQLFGAASDLDGEFVILNIPPGIYSIEVSHIQYHTITVTGIQIHADLTTQQKIELTPSALIRPEAEVKAKPPKVELGKSVKETRIDKQKMQDLRPENVQTLLQMIGGGFKEDKEGKFHVRGSRDGEVAFIVDGVDRRDPLVSTATSSNISIGAGNVEEVNVLTGGFAAEYGRAMGAIVQVTTAEGSPKGYSGRFEYQTDKIIDTYSFNTDRGEVSFGGPVPFTRKWEYPITFYITTIGKLSDTYTPFDIDRPANDYMGLGIDLPERQQNSFQTSLKLAKRLTETKKLSLYLSEAYSQWDIYPLGEGGVSGNYGYNYKYNLDNRPWAKNDQFTGALTYTHQISDRTFYEVKAIAYRTHSAVQPRGKNPGEFTLQGDIEDNLANAFDLNRNRKLEPGEYLDTDGNGFMDGYMDVNRNGLFDGGGEGYEDLNYNGRWDRGEDWVDLNGNGIYDAAEPWIDVVNPLTGENNLGVYDPWDTYNDLNGNGRWDPAEPQLPEHDWNKNGDWDGERFIDANGNGRYDAWEPWDDYNGNFLHDGGEPYADANGNGRYDPGEPFIDQNRNGLLDGEPYIDTNGNGRFDYSEGYDDKNENGTIDERDLLPNIANTDRIEPFIDGDYWWDTGEPFIDEPDPITGEYNSRWDQGEVFFDLPSSLNPQTGAGYFFLGDSPVLNGKYDGPNYGFDEYELFTQPATWKFGSDPSRPVEYSFNEEARGNDWPEDIFSFIPGKSTWTNRTLHDTEAPEFNFPNGRADIDQEWWLDYNNDGIWNRADLFLNPGEWDPTAFWQDRVSLEYSLKFDIQSQVSKHHLMKTGTEIKFRDLSMQSIEQPNQPYTGEAQLPPGSAYPDRGGVRDFYQYKPIEGAAYVQDQMEFEGLIVNAGLRGDFIIHDSKVIDEFTERLERDEPGAIVARRGTYKISPRLGISHPITEQSKLYFNYGHFYQAPSFQYFYRSATANFEANSTIGNPNLEYEKTVQYELGVNTLISEFVVLDVSGYYKDQYDLISTSDERWKNMTLDRYVNLDYGRMRGFEFTIEKIPSHHYAFTFNYDFSYAYGKASDQHANRDSRLSGVPYNWDEHPLDWDETHKIKAYITVSYGQGEHPRLLGLVMPDDWMLTLQWEFGSGLPYTPSRYLVGIENQNLVLPNSSRLPWHETTTLKFEKYYSVGRMGNNRLFFGFTVGNLFNKRNVDAVYTQTGTADKAVNPLNPEYNPFENRQDYDANPRNYSSPRNVLFRIGMTF